MGNEYPFWKEKKGEQTTLQRRIFDLSKDMQEQMVLYGHHAVMEGARDAALHLPLPCPIPGLSRQSYAQMFATMASVLECTDCILYMALKNGAYPTMTTDLQTLHDLSFVLGQFVGADDETCEAASQKLIQSVCGDNSDEASNYGKILQAKSVAFLREAKVREYLARDCREELTTRNMVMAIRGDLLSYMQKPDLTKEEKVRTRKELAFLVQVPFLWITQTPLDSLYEDLLSRGDAVEALAIEKWAETLGANEDPQIPHLTMDDLWTIWDQS